MLLNKYTRLSNECIPSGKGRFCLSPEVKLVRAQRTLARQRTDRTVGPQPVRYRRYKQQNFQLRCCLNGGSRDYIVGNTRYALQYVDSVYWSVKCQLDIVRFILSRDLESKIPRGTLCRIGKDLLTLRALSMPDSERSSLIDDEGPWTSRKLSPLLEALSRSTSVYLRRTRMYRSDGKARRAKYQSD